MNRSLLSLLGSLLIAFPASAQASIASASNPAVSAPELTGPRRRTHAIAAAPSVQAVVLPQPALAEQEASRVRWRSPLLGMALGTAAGFGWGLYLHRNIERGETISGPPAFFYTVPLGAVTGLLLGLALD